ncbi:MAG TPA: GTPase ObgE [Acidimicrobiales bacterium]|jgi:GTP-binding protein|nr:GTPase ObgE [Acidimicrobiales bacterium]
MSGFVDEAQLHAKAGDGGAGVVAFRREAHVDKGGPDGGDGGRGGDVWLVATTNQASLLGFRDHPHRRATDGAHGSGKRKHGTRGPDLEVPVPVGTVVRDRDGSILCDLNGPGDRWLAAEGGQGGRGNARFLSNSRRAPAFAEQGEHGQERWLGLELKLAADVALVGFPNVGKSTLISTVSAARPKVADYPFTTLQPHLGVVRVGRRDSADEVQLVMADVPGLVEGAAEGRGLGHRFLRHVERARILVVLLDLAAVDGRSPADQLTILLGELGRYQPELLARPRLVVGSRADLVPPAGTGTDDVAVPGGDDAAGAEADGGARVAGSTELDISAATGQGIPQLLGRLAQMVTEARQAEIPTGPSQVVIHRPLPDGVVVERTDARAWRLVGRAAERAVGFSDLNDPGALDEAIRRLRRLGVDRALARAGAHDGDEVEVGQVSFTWYRDGADAVLDVPDDARPAAIRRRGRR